MVYTCFLSVCVYIYIYINKWIKKFLWKCILKNQKKMLNTSRQSKKKSKINVVHLSSYTLAAPLLPVSYNLFEAVEDFSSVFFLTPSKRLHETGSDGAAKEG